MNLITIYNPIYNNTLTHTHKKMDIVNVLQPFAATISPDNRVTITIGKHIQAGKKFHSSNKLFFDFLKEFLNKNGWFIKEQNISKHLHYRHTSQYLKCTLSATPSVVLGLDVPVTLTTTLYTKSHEHSYIFHGLYFDILCEQCHHQVMETPATPQSLPDGPLECVVQEETTVLNKHLCSIDVVLIVNKAHDPPLYEVQVEMSSCHSELENEELRALFDIIDLAMCKYKKIDRTFPSIFK